MSTQHDSPRTPESTPARSQRNTTNDDLIYSASQVPLTPYARVRKARQITSTIRRRRQQNNMPQVEMTPFSKKARLSLAASVAVAGTPWRTPARKKEEKFDLRRDLRALSRALVREKIAKTKENTASTEPEIKTPKRERTPRRNKQNETRTLTPEVLDSPGGNEEEEATPTRRRSNSSVNSRMSENKRNERNSSEKILISSRKEAFNSQDDVLYSPSKTVIETPSRKSPIKLHQWPQSQHNSNEIRNTIPTITTPSRQNITRHSSVTPTRSSNFTKAVTPPQQVNTDLNSSLVSSEKIYNHSYIEVNRRENDRLSLGRSRLSENLPDFNATQDHETPMKMFDTIELPLDYPDSATRARRKSTYIPRESNVFVIEIDEELNELDKNLMTDKENIIEERVESSPTPSRHYTKRRSSGNFKILDDNLDQDSSINLNSELDIQQPPDLTEDHEPEIERGLEKSTEIEQGNDDDIIPDFQNTPKHIYQQDGGEEEQNLVLPTVDDHETYSALVNPALEFDLDADYSIITTDSHHPTPKRPFANTIKAPQGVSQTRKIKPITSAVPSSRTIPSRVLKDLVTSMTRKKLHRSAYESLAEASEMFFEQAAKDLAAYAKHAKRKVIEPSDVLMLMKRQAAGAYQDSDTPREQPYVLAKKYLPQELVDEIVEATLSVKDQ